MFSFSDITFSIFYHLNRFFVPVLSGLRPDWLCFNLPSGQAAPGGNRPTGGFRAHGRPGQCPDRGQAKSRSLVGECRETTTGVCILAALSNISDETRPVVKSSRSFVDIPVNRHSPWILSRVLCRPISSATTSRLLGIGQGRGMHAAAEPDKVPSAPEAASSMRALPSA